MEKDTEIKKDEPIVIQDECGDTLWDAVLEPPPPPKGGTLESKTLKCFLKKQTVGIIVDKRFNDDVEDKMFGGGMQHRSLPSGKGDGACLPVGRG
jgi:hypothetical protein